MLSGFLDLYQKQLLPLMFAAAVLQVALLEFFYRALLLQFCYSIDVCLAKFHAVDFILV